MVGSVFASLNQSLERSVAKEFRRLKQHKAGHKEFWVLSEKGMICSTSNNISIR